MGWGFLKGLGKIAAIGAAPFTGGASLTALPMIDGISNALGSGAQSAASNRGTKAELMLDQNSDLERQLIAREEEKRSAQGNAYRNAMLGSRAATWKPSARPSGVPGSYAQTNAQGANLAGNELFKQAMLRMQAKDMQDQSGMPAYRNLANDKDFKKTMNPGFLEKLAGFGSAVTPLVGAAFGGGGNGLPGYTEDIK